MQLDLAQAMRARGHTVDVLAYEDVFPTPPRGKLGALLRSYTHAVAPILRRRARHYDVVDGIEGTIVETKQELGLDGLLVARTIALNDFYRRWEDEARARWPQHPRGRALARPLRRALLRRDARQARLSRQIADGMFVCNLREAEHVAADIGTQRVRMLPHGLFDNERKRLAEAARARDPGGDPTVVWLGTWDARKGKYDLPGIIRGVRASRPETSFLLLGTHAPAQAVLAELGAASKRVQVRSSFLPEELPELLSGCCAMAFPSYLESFGFAVIEALAAGLPVVAYDIPGPRDILAPLDARLLVDLGDVDTFAARLLEQMDGRGVAAQRCIARAADFRWETIAERTLEAYAAWAGQTR